MFRKAQSSSHFRAKWILKKFATLVISFALGGSILTGCGSFVDTSFPTGSESSVQTMVETIYGKADLEKYVSNVKLEIRSGILYVSVYDGSTYKTTIEADDITVIKPAEDGQGGTVSTATIMRNQHPVMYFSRSYVQYTLTSKDLSKVDYSPIVKKLYKYNGKI